MSKKLVIILLIFLLPLAGCGTFSTKNWKVNGIPMEDFKTSPKNYTKLAVGVGTSFAVHYLGHVTYLEANGIEWRQDGIEEIVEDDISNSKKRWVGRSGFVSQLAVGAVLKYGPWSDDFKTGYFVTGYHIGTAAEITTYPILHRDTGDLDFIDEGNGNQHLEYGIYSISSLWLLK